MIKPWLWMKQDVRHHVAVVLSIVWLVSIFHYPNFRTLTTPLLAVIVGLTFEYLIHLAKGINEFPSSALVTALLIGLNLPPWDTVLPVMAAVLIALGSKFIRWPHRHLFNPAAFGIIMSGLLFRSQTSWWAASWSWLPPLIIVVGMFPVLKKLRRLWLPATFLGAYIVWLVVVTGGVRIVPSILVDGTVMLFALVMLPEPMTSPASGRWRYIFGLLVAFLVIGLNHFLRYSPFPVDLLLGALLLGDLVAGVIQWWFKSKSVNISPVSIN